MATTDITTLDPNSKYFIVKNEIFAPTEITNTDDPSQYVDSSYAETDLNQVQVFNKLLQTSIIDEPTLNKYYLNIYQQLIKTYINAGSNSVFLRNRSVATNYNGVDIIKNINFLDFLDIQELKDKVVDSVSNDPCILMDPKPKPVHPLKEQMLKANFISLCRLHINYLKMCNLFLSSVFENSEFYSKDTTFSTYAYQTFKQKMVSIIPSYYNSIKVYLYNELNTLLETGTEFVDEITKQKYEFTYPLNDDNLEINVDKYLNYLFNKEHLFVSNKYNIAFNQTILDADEVTNFALYPVSNTKQSLYSVQDYFFDNLPVIVKNADESLGGKLTTFLTFDSSRYLVLLLDISDSLPIGDSKIRTYRLSLNLLERDFTSFTISSNLNEFTSFNVSTIKTVEKDLDYPLNNSIEISTILLELKEIFLANERLKTFINFCFPLNKILNVASFFYIQTNMKTYELVTNAIDGSVKTIDTVHDMILGNEKKIDCETPSDPLNTNNPILGINLEIAKMIAQAPIQILKGLEETYDPNIAIASKLRDLSVAAGLAPTPVALWSLALLPALTIPPPVGIGPPLISPWGYIYWGVDAGEVLTSYAKNGFKKDDGGFTSDTKFGVKGKITISENPFIKNKNC